jgi:hypothetical protein
MFAAKKLNSIIKYMVIKGTIEYNLTFSSLLDKS